MIVVGEPISKVNNKTHPMAIAAAKSFFISLFPCKNVSHSELYWFDFS